MGLAGPLLVFTGIWHALEWLMGGRNKDTLLLIPFGIGYVVLGYLIVTFTGGTVVLWIALAVTCIGLIGALATRTRSLVRSWVIWVFVVVDVAIIASLLMALFGSA